MNTIKSILSVFEKHPRLIFIWAIISLALSFIYPPLAAGVYAGLWFFIIRRWRGLTALILAATLLTAQAQTNTLPSQPGNGSGDDPKLVGPCMCLVVLVIGAVVVYSLVKFCRAHLPPPPVNPSTNAWPPVITNGVPTNAFPALQIQSISCLVVSNLSMPDPGQATFTMDCRIRADGSMSLAPAPGAYWTDDNDGVTAGEYLAALPTNAAPVEVSYAAGVLSITEPGQASRQVILERSPDMVNWTPIATNVWSSRFEQVSEVDPDAPETQAFYRVR